MIGCYGLGMVDDTEHPPGAVAPATGHYRLLNVFGTPTDHTTHVRRGDTLPAAPRGHGWLLEQETDVDGCQDCCAGWTSGCDSAGARRNVADGDSPKNDL
jgi:hypothetical protein